MLAGLEEYKGSYIPQSDIRFNRIVNPDVFIAPAPETPKEPQGPARFIFEARQIIDKVDPDICDLLGSFNLAAQNETPTELSPNVIKKLDGAPQELLMSLVTYIDFSSTEDSVKERNLQQLAGLVAQRFLAISLVAHGKKLNGEKTSFHPERHEKVLENRSARIAHSHDNTSLWRKMFGSFMEAGCHIQDAYINDTTTRNDPIASKLTQFGVTPIIR